MLDIKFIRENLEVVKLAVTKKNMTVDLDRLIKVDDERRELMQSMETKKAEQNSVSAGIPSATPEARQSLIAEMQTLKTAIQAQEEKFKPVMEEWQALMLQVPNVPDMSVPDGESDTDNEEIKTWGEQKSFSFDD